MATKSDSNIYSPVNPDMEASQDDLEDASVPSLGMRRVLKFSLVFVVMAIVGATAKIASLQKNSSERTQKTQDVVELYKIHHNDSPEQMLSSAGTNMKGNEEAYLHSTVPDEYESVGTGVCQDIDMVAIAESSRAPWVSALVEQDGSSTKCAELCDSHGPDCTGYMTSQGKCSILTDSSFWPAAADGTPNTHCFWRHRFLTSTQIQADKPVTKKIWAFWHTLGENPTLPSYIQLCQDSWKATNPDWPVTLLNLTTVWDWLTPEELPKETLPKDLQHTSDAVRMAILLKYGGVWLDATVLLLRPLEPWIYERPYMYFQRFPDLEDRNKRVTPSLYVENWFFALPPEDEVLRRVQKCVRNFHFHDYKPYGLGYLNDELEHFYSKFNFTSRQLQDMYSLGMWTTYLSMHICHYRVFDEDAGIRQWWLSDQIHHLSSYEVMEFYFQDQKHPSLFENEELDVAARVTAPDGPPFLKFDGDVFKTVLDQEDGLQMFWCKRHTFRLFLEFIGMTSPVECPSEYLAKQ